MTIGLHLHRDEVLGRVVLHPPASGEGPKQARLYIADGPGHRILEASVQMGPDGWPVADVLRTFGSGEPGLEDADAASARFHHPVATWRVDDLLWVADSSNHCLRVIDLVDGRVGTAAGSGKKGNGQNCHAQRPLDAALPAPVSVTAAQGGILFASADPPRIWAYLPDTDRLGPLVGSGRPGYKEGKFPTVEMQSVAGIVALGARLMICDGDRIRLAHLARRQAGTMLPVQEVPPEEALPDDKAPLELVRPVDLATSEHRFFIADAGRDAIVSVDVRDHFVDSVTADGALSAPTAVEAFGALLLVADGESAGFKAVHADTGEVRALALQPWLREG